MKILTVRKTGLTKALQVTDDQSEVEVRRWLMEAGHDPAADLSELIEAKSYFLRDEGSAIVYLCPRDDFDKNWDVQTWEFTVAVEVGPNDTEEKQEFEATLKALLKDI